MTNDEIRMKNEVPMTDVVMQSTLSSLLLLSFALAGCGSSLPAGMGGLKVTPQAEPKAGYRQPDDLSGGYVAGVDGPADANDSRRNPFRLIDYRNLEDIVVYLVPENGAVSAGGSSGSGSITIDAGRPGGEGRQGLSVASVGGELIVRNTASRPMSVYLRSGAGTLTDVGAVPPGGSKLASLKSPGSLTLFRETGQADDEKLADIYVAPTSWVRKTLSGETISFAPIPPGRYTLTVWHPRLPGSQQSVDVAPGGYTSVSVKIGVNPLPKVP